MKFKTRKQCSAYADVFNKLENDVDAVFYKYEKRLIAVNDNSALRGLLDEVRRLEIACTEKIKTGLSQWLDEWGN
jgi:hypothetical protein